MTSYNGQTITYDEIGNPLSYINGMQLSWERGRKLASVDLPSSQQRISYQYYPTGERVCKIVEDTENEAYIRTDFYWQDGYLLGQKTGNNVLRFLYDETGRICGFLHNTEPYYFCFNLQGDVIAIFDNTGAIVAEYDYDDWGKPISISGDTTIANLNPIRYRGYYYDNETGFYYLNSRYYDPEIGRFINADSAIGINQDITAYNLFVYCGNNPIVRADIEGYFWDTVFDVVSLVFSVADVIQDPSDPWAWAGMVGDIADLIPFVSGVGEVTKALGAAKKAGELLDDIHDVRKTVENMAELAEAGQDGYKTFKTAKKYMENVSNIEWHHLVEQSQAVRSGISKISINNSSNLVGISSDLHHKISGFYSSKPDFLKNSSQFKTVRDWVSTLNYQQQYTFGVFVLQRCKYI